MQGACPERSASGMPTAPTMRIDQLLHGVLTLLSVVKYLPLACMEPLMIRPTFLALTSSLLLSSTALAADQTIYRWRDASGGLHYSNQSRGTPTEATAVELPPLGSIHVPPALEATGPRRPSRRHGGRAPASPCGPADPSNLAEAIQLGVDQIERDADLTLLVGGLPVSVSRDANVQTLVTPWDPDAPQAHLSQSAVAYPAGTSCPAAPPFVRYATNQRRDGVSRGLCDDYRRAFAQVGIAASRNAGIARSFREITRDFVRVRAEGNIAVASGFRVARDEMFTSDAMQLAPYLTVPLDPWIVAAHASQTDDLATDSEILVQQLTVALEEIDRAARASSCWN